MDFKRHLIPRLRMVVASLLALYAVRFADGSLVNYEADSMEEAGGVFYFRNGEKFAWEIVVAIPVSQVKAIQRIE